MPRELRHNWTQQKEKEEFRLTLEDWKELKRDFDSLQGQIQGLEQKWILTQSKIVKFFDTLTQKLENQDTKTEELKTFVQEQAKSLLSKIQKNRQDQEVLFSNKVQDLIEEAHSLHDKNSFQIKDLCQSLTHYSEQFWGLKEELENLKNRDLEK